MSIINLGKWKRNNVGYFRHIIVSTSVGVDVIKEASSLAVESQLSTKEGGQ